jgi:hypothetical protein
MCTVLLPTGVATKLQLTNISNIADRIFFFCYGLKIQFSAMELILYKYSVERYSLSEIFCKTFCDVLGDDYPHLKVTCSF